MKVIVKDDREFPDYKNVQITTLVRNVINEMGADWGVCIEVGAKIQDAIHDADYLTDDTGVTWARSFTPSGERDI